MTHALDLYEFWRNSPFPTTKINTYFYAYADLFSHLRNTNCVFLETGVLGGGSLFMWRKWLGPDARIIGIDLNPEAEKWRDYGFEIFIGDQGDPHFWKNTFNQIGKFDALLDDGGHQSFQQIVTLNEAVRFASNKCVIAIEDTHTSLMRDFQAHGQHSFLNYVKQCTDVLTARAHIMYPDRIKPIINAKIMEDLAKIYSIQFFGSLVAFKVDSEIAVNPTSSYNQRAPTPSDFRYQGVSEASVLWPDPFRNELVLVKGGSVS